MRAPRVTLVQSFVAALAVVTALLVLLAALVLGASRRSILANAERLREATARRIAEQVRAQLDGALAAVSGIEQEIALGFSDPADAGAMQAAALRQLARNPFLAEVTFVHAERTGFEEQGRPVLARQGRWQRSAAREQGGSLSAPRTVSDPTAHLTFISAASRDVAGAPIWTDLAWSALDHRVVVSVQKAVEDRRGRFAGVARAALLASAIDSIAELRMGRDDPHRIFLADAEGRLVTRLSPDDRLELIGDELRIAPAHLPRAVELALRGPLRDEGQGVERTGEVAAGGERWLATFRALAGSQEWFVGIVVPEAAYTRELRELRARLILGCAAILAVVLIVGIAALVALRSGLGRIRGTTAQMRALRFEPTPPDAPFRDVHEVLSGLEQAKTALRGMGKYAPLDLVRELYAANREPALGGELRELSILFTDLEGFTSLSERIPPDRLAHALGLYFETLTAALRGCGATIDKFIGDAVMAFWNAPAPREDHERLACAAILACREATARLYVSPAWAGLPPLRTRFGLHRDTVMVGHFGAPERFSYTALGDGVNVASRLEGLGKQYGVDAVVSDAIVERAAGSFAFRRLDRVAVKGRSEAIVVYELIGRADAAVAATA